MRIWMSVLKFFLINKVKEIFEFVLGFCETIYEHKFAILKIISCVILYVAITTSLGILCHILFPNFTKTNVVIKGLYTSILNYFLIGLFMEIYIVGIFGVFFIIPVLIYYILYSGIIKPLYVWLRTNWRLAMLLAGVDNRKIIVDVEKDAFYCGYRQEFSSFMFLKTYLTSDLKHNTSKEYHHIKLLYNEEEFKRFKKENKYLIKIQKLELRQITQDMLK